MSATRNLAMAVTVAGLAAPMSALAADHYSFPSASGTQIAAVVTPAFLPNAPVDGAQPQVLPGAPGTLSLPPMLTNRHDRHEPLPPPAAGYGSRDAAGYRFVTEAISTSAYANYVADYARVFAPGYAVKSWTDRVFGVVEIGYGAVDGWTSATYGMERLRGPSRRKETAPDLSVMPTFRPQPELEQSPTFKRN